MAGPAGLVRNEKARGSNPLSATTAIADETRWCSPSGGVQSEPRRRAPAAVGIRGHSTLVSSSRTAMSLLRRVGDELLHLGERQREAVEAAHRVGADQLQEVGIELPLDCLPQHGTRLWVASTSSNEDVIVRGISTGSPSIATHVWERRSRLDAPTATT